MKRCRVQSIVQNFIRFYSVVRYQVKNPGIEHVGMIRHLGSQTGGQPGERSYRGRTGSRVSRFIQPNRHPA